MIEKICEIFCNCYPQFKMSSERFESLLLNSNTHIITFPDDQNPLGFLVSFPAAACRPVADQIPGSSHQKKGDYPLNKIDRPGHQEKV